MSTTAIDIANMALGHLGEEPIASFDSNGTRAQRECARFYENTKAMVLSNPHWGFAKFTQVLARETATPDNPEWKYAYAKPTDPALIKPIRVWPRSPYEIEGDKILSNNPELTLQYLGDADEGNMPPYFVAYFALVLANRLCMPITKNGKLKSALLQDLEDYGPLSRFADASDEPNIPIVDSPFVDVRG